MRRIGVILLVGCLALLPGCQMPAELEDHAYALVLGIDAVPAGGVELTIRFPRIGQSKDAKAEEPSGGDAYLVISAKGADYGQALEQLQWAASRELNLSQLKMIVVSEALAGDAAFAPLISEIAQTRHLYTTAAFVVCEGTARAFVEGQKTTQGTRLSSEIAALLRHYEKHGYIPKATFADLYYDTRSGCSDAVGIRAFPAEARDDSAPASAAVLPEPEDARESVRSPAARRFLGAAILHEGRLCMKLDARETLCLNLACGTVDSFSYECDGKSCALSSLRRPRKRAAVEDGAITASLDIYLTSEDAMDADAVRRLEACLSDDVIGLVHKCQAAGVEPFGFAASGMAGFTTAAAWEAFGWCDRFREAEVHVDVHIESSLR